MQNASRLFEVIQFALPSMTFSLASRIIRPLGGQNPNPRLHLSRSRRKLSAMAVRALEEQGMPMLSVPIEHNANSDRGCERG